MIRSNKGRELIRYKFIFLSLLLLVRCQERNEIVEYYPNGQVESIYETLEGSLHGKATGYHENGNLKFEGEFQNGKRIGYHKIYDRKIPNCLKEIWLYELDSNVSIVKEFKQLNRDELTTRYSKIDNRIQIKCSKVYIQSDSLYVELKSSNLDTEYSFIILLKDGIGSDVTSDSFIGSGRKVEIRIPIKQKEVSGLFFQMNSKMLNDTVGVSVGTHNYFSIDLSKYFDKSDSTIKSTSISELLF